MLPLLTAPWALAAFAALPALAALYWLRNTWRETRVSSLMLWLHESRAQASGLRMRRLQTPLLFFLELTAIALLALAAAGPRLDTAQGNWPLVVVLDDSFSMLAGGDDSPRRRALAALENELRWGEDHPIRFILAGQTPQLLGDLVSSWSEARVLLEGWRCHAPKAALPQATTLASELSGDKVRLLVISDHGQTPDLTSNSASGRLQWWSYGKPRDNLAFVGAARSVRDGVDRCLLAVASFSDQPLQTTLTVRSVAGKELHRESLTLTPRQTHRTVLSLSNIDEAVVAQLADDALPFDNKATLLRDETPPVSVVTQIQQEMLRVPVEKSLTATGRLDAKGAVPHILITDHAEPAPAAVDAWIVQLFAEKEAEAFVGPFVLDRTHPLTDGLQLAGVVWGAGSGRELPGNPVILAGGVPIITDHEGVEGRHHLRIRLRPDLSTVVDSPAWPILIWNLIQWRATALPGVRRPNIRLGDTAELKLPPGIASVLHFPALSPSRPYTVQQRRVVLQADEAGVHTVEAGAIRYQFAVNAVWPDESDLTQCKTGRWGEWSDDLATASAAIQLAWIPLLLVLAILTMHLALASRPAG